MAAKTVKKQWVTSANWKAKNNIDTSGDTAVTYCKNLTLAGYSDWRLPTLKELSGLYVRRGSLKHNSEGIYWSSTTVENEERSAMYVYFYTGYKDSEWKRSSNYVRCVRTAQ